MSKCLSIAISRAVRMEATETPDKILFLKEHSQEPMFPLTAEAAVAVLGDERCNVEES